MPQERTETFTTADADALRAAMGSFPTGVAVITSGTGADTHAVTASSLTSVSLDPLLVLISIRSDGKIRHEIEKAEAFTVNILNAGQEHLAREFARRDRPEGEAALRRIGRLTGPAGGALVPGAVAGLECTLETRYVGGDHVIFLGRVHAIHTAGIDDRPLVSYHGEFASVTTEPRPGVYLG
ncbi:flavin reductase family protein [Actinomadura fibrosa]|uniref:Flavin reductase family protein n=1 Tax=Actinomadura fibrosa TaxID=111802 RepID=A0ABW2XRL5_9ACTN|nr:flavin reductase family protein [Actinomadura fibrosa]